MVLLCVVCSSGLCSVFCCHTHRKCNLQPLAVWVSGVGVTVVLALQLLSCVTGSCVAACSELKGLTVINVVWREVSQC